MSSSRPTTGAITGVLDRLERAGFVRREPDPEDRRRLIVRVNHERIGEVEGCLQPLVTRALALTEGWSPALRRDLATYVDGFADLLEAEAKRLSVAARGGMIGDAYLAPLGDVTHGRLLLATGAPRLSLGAAALGQQVRMVAETAATRVRFEGSAGDDLVKATFDGPPPEIRATDGTVTMRYRRRLLDTRSRAARVALNPTIPWSIEVDGGITDLDGDLRSVRLADLEVRGGANHLKLRLPEPDGTTRVTLLGGASLVDLRRPVGTAVLLRIRGGASHVRFDGQRLESIAGDMRLRSDDFAAAANRYEIELVGGVSDLRVAAR